MEEYDGGIISNNEVLPVFNAKQYPVGVWLDSKAKLLTIIRLIRHYPGQ